MTASAFKESDADPESDGTEWSGFLGHSEVSPEIAAVLMSDQDRAITEYDDLFEDVNDEP